MTTIGKLGYTVAEFLSDKLSDEYPDYDIQLDPGDIFEYTYYGKVIKAGDFEIKFEIDKNDVLAESNEANNIKTLPVTIYASEKAADTFAITNINYTFNSASSTNISWQTSKKTDAYLKYINSKYGTFNISISLFSRLSCLGPLFVSHFEFQISDSLSVTWASSGNIGRVI